MDKIYHKKPINNEFKEHFSVVKFIINRFKTKYSGILILNFIGCAFYYIGMSYLYSPLVNHLSHGFYNYTHFIGFMLIFIFMYVLFYIINYMRKKVIVLWVHNHLFEYRKKLLEVYAHSNQHISSEISAHASGNFQIYHNFLIQSVPNAALASIQTIVGTIILIILNVKLSLFALFSIIPIVWYIWNKNKLSAKLVNDTHNEEVKSLDYFNILSYNSLFFKVNNIYENLKKIFEKINEQLFSSISKTNQHFTDLNINFNLYSQFVIVSSIIFGSILVFYKYESAGNVIAFVILTQTLYFCILQLCNELFNILKVKERMVLIDEILRFNYEPKKTDNIIIPHNSKIVFNNVSTKILDNISFEDDSSMLYILGKSGSGKSTFIKTLLGINYAPGVSIADVSVNPDNIKKIYDKVGFLPQSFEFLNLSIFDHFRLFKYDITEGEVKELLTLLNLYDEVKVFYAGIHSVISREHNIQLSGGQYKRLALALLLAKNPDLLVLDEVFSGLDQASVNIVTNFLRKIITYKKVILISHHLDHVDKDNMVIILEKGRILFHGLFVNAPL